MLSRAKNCIDAGTYNNVISSKDEKKKPFVSRTLKGTPFGLQLSAVAFPQSFRAQLPSYRLRVTVEGCRIKIRS